MTIKRHTFPLACFLLVFTGAADLRGQSEDFQTWWELEMNKELTGKLDLNGELEQRFKNNSLQYSRTLITVAASYDVLDYLSLEGGARTIFYMEGEQGLQVRYRLHLDGEGSYDLSGYELSLRVRLQYGFDKLPDFRYISFNGLVNRNRLKVAHHIFGTRFDWFATVESWHGSLIEGYWRTFAMRYSAGIRFSPDFTSRLSLRYLLEQEFNVIAPRCLHVLVFGYTYRF